MEKLKEVWDYELLQEGENPLTVNWLDVFMRSPDFGPDGRDQPGITLRLSAHNHNFSDSWNIYRQLHVYGTGGGSGNDGTILTFPNGKCGIITNWLRDGRSDRSTIQNLSIRAFGVQNANAFAHGVVPKAPLKISDCRISGFVDGVHMFGAASNAADPSTCNLFRLYNLRIDSCYGHGVYIFGADSSAGVGINVDVTSCAKWGIYDSSFLGNTWIGCHAATNGSGSFCNLDPNSYGTWIGCYAEIDQPAAIINSPAIFMGGITDVIGGGGILTMRSGELTTTRIKARNTKNPLKRLYSRIGTYSNLDNSIFEFGCENTNQIYRLMYEYSGAGWWSWNYQALGAGSVLSFCTQNAVAYNQGYVAPKVALGDSFQSGILNCAGLTIPTTGDWPKGTIMYNKNVVPGGYIGWVCTTASKAATPTTAYVPPVFKPFGKIEL